MGYNNIIVVDGGSNDRTVEIAKSKGVTVVFQRGKGKANAIATGINYVKTPYVLIIDGDYTYPAKYIDDLYRKILEGYDEVIGARVYGEGYSFMYRIGNKILTAFFNLLFGVKLRDVLSGMYMLRLESVRDALFETKGFSIESEIVAHIIGTSGVVTEVPIEYRKRVGKKKLKVLHGIKIAIDMIRLTWRYNPVFIIFFMGSLLLVPGIILSGWVLYQYLTTGVKYYVKGILAAIMSVGGFVSLALAILSLYFKRMEYRLRRRLMEIEKRIKEYGKRSES